MRDETAEFVYPVLDHLVALKGRLDRGETASLEEEQSILGRLLTHEPSAERPPQGTVEDAPACPIEELRYAIVCLIDEFFIANTSWTDRWNENKFESKLYFTNDRAWKFWRGANQALAAGEVEMVEVYLLCVMLGFRGTMAEDRKGLEEWVERAKRLIELRRARLWSEPPSREPRTFVPPLRGRWSYESASLRLGFLVLATVSLLVFLVVQRLGSLSLE